MRINTMNRITTLALLFVGFTNINPICHAQIYPNPPVYDINQRLELARELLKPLEPGITKNPNEVHRGFWLKCKAMLDPDVAAKFILANPLPKDSPLYDNEALSILFAKGSRLKSGLVLQLLEKERHRNFLYGWTRAVIESRKVGDPVYQAAVNLLQERVRESPVSNIHEIASLRAVASRIKDPKIQKLIEDSCLEYFESGRAEKMWREFQKAPNMGGSYRQHIRGINLVFAPESLKAKFKSSPKSTNANQHDSGLQFALNLDWMPDFELKKILKSIHRYDFDRQAEQYMNEAWFLGKVAKLDADQAIKWAESAPAEAKPWAQIQIAGAVADTDSELAKQMLKNAYAAIKTSDHSPRLPKNYNYPSPSIACAGLPIVRYAAPEILDECIDVAIDCCQQHRASVASTARSHILKSVAVIASYDMDKARKLFDEVQSSVSLHHSPEFFVALAAIAPDEIFDELQQIPEKDNRGIQWPLRIRMAIVPALCQKNDQQFWETLTATRLLPVDKSSLE